MAHKRIPLTFACCFLILFCNIIVLKGQSASTATKKIAARLDNWTADYPQEKVYLHFDKPYYAIGDDIWFKAYVTAGPKHQLSALSGTLNVDLIENSEDTIIRSIKLRLMNGVGKGDFFLTDTLNAGNFRVRAYTNWMRNAGPEYFFDKTLVIGKSIIVKNPNKNNNIFRDEKAVAEKRERNKITQLSKNAGIQFFPEGGELVNGVWSKIGFKVVGNDGFGKEVSGVITDNTNKEIASFKTRHLGMGEFIMMPQSGKSYSAHLTYPDGSNKDVPLPGANDNGYTLTISNTDPDYVSFRLATSPLTNIKNLKPLSLIAQCNGVVYFAGEYTFENNIVASKIPKSRFISGITQFTLFNSEGLPLNERIIFIDNPDRSKLTVKAQQNIFGEGQKIKLNLKATSPENLSLPGNYSVTIINADKVPYDFDDDNNILSQLLLKSDIKGYIEKPGYYFANQGDTARAADLDVLMLTQGYRRFQWKQILNDSPPPILYKPENALSVIGEVQTLTGKPLENAKISLYAKNKGVIALDTISNKTGKFIFDNLEFPDSTRLVIQARNAEDKKYVQIKVDELPTPLLNWNAKISDNSTNSIEFMQPYLQNSKMLYNRELSTGTGRHSTLLKEVNITAKAVHVDHTANLNGKGRANQIIKGEVFDHVGCPTIIECLQGKVLSVRFAGNKAFSARGAAISFNDNPMLIYIDGMRSSEDALTFINPQDVESIEILNSVAYTMLYGSAGAPGVILVNMKQEPDPKSFKAYNPWIISYKPKGYYAARTFYSPQYDDPKTDKAIADLRSTVYWNPDIVTDKDGNAEFDFFNATAGRYQATIEGLDINGHIGRKTFNYVVK